MKETTTIKPLIPEKIKYPWWGRDKVHKNMLCRFISKDCPDLLLDISENSLHSPITVRSEDEFEPWYGEITIKVEP